MLLQTDIAMRMISDPPLTIDPTSLKEWQSAVVAISMAASKIRREQPGLTERQVWQQARARCAPEMLAVIEAREEAARRHQIPADPASPAGGLP